MVGAGYLSHMSDQETLGSRIRAARTAAGLTQKAVADHFKIARVNVTQWESDTTRPDGHRLPELARLLGVPSDSFFSNEPSEPLPISVIVPGSTLVSNSKMPVYAAAMGGDGHIIVSFEQIDEIKRPAELENVRGGYGLLIKGESMVPALWDGDMALVNPHLRPTRDFNHVFFHEPPHGQEVEAMVKQLVSANDRDWTVKQWNPAREWKESRQVWQICHRIVGKYDRR